MIYQHMLHSSIRWIFRKGWQNIYMCDFLGIPKHFSEVSYVFTRIFNKKPESYDLFMYQI